MFGKNIVNVVLSGDKETARLERYHEEDKELINLEIPLWHRLKKNTQKEIVRLMTDVSFERLSSTGGYKHNAYSSNFNRTQYFSIMNHITNHSSDKDRLKLYLLSVIDSPLLDKNIVNEFLANVDANIVIVLHDTGILLPQDDWFHFNKSAVRKSNLRFTYALDAWLCNKNGDVTLLDAYENAVLFEDFPTHNMTAGLGNFNDSSTYGIFLDNAMSAHGLYGEKALLNVLRGEVDDNMKNKSPELYNALIGAGKATFNDFFLSAYLNTTKRYTLGEFVDFYSLNEPGFDELQEFLAKEEQIKYVKINRKLTYFFYVLLNKNEDKLFEAMFVIIEQIKMSIHDAETFDLRNFCDFLRNYGLDDTGIPLSFHCAMNGVEYFASEDDMR